MTVAGPFVRGARVSLLPAVAFIRGNADGRHRILPVTGRIMGALFPVGAMKISTAKSYVD
ncbi:MAG: hypothetical protein LUQ25_02395 [Methanoregulaceae archaeon]|nr:hypothetical protein [Methanoregulaceae archaeon]